MGVKTIQQFRHLGPFTHPLSPSLSVDHDLAIFKPLEREEILRSGKWDSSRC